MKYVGMTALSLIVWFSLVLPLAKVMADDRAGEKEKPVTALASDDQKGKPRDQQVESRSEKLTLGPDKLIYTPPSIGAPGGRVGGSSRGNGSVILSVLAPDHTGLTVEEQPSLYWYLSQSTSYPIEVTISDDRNISPVLETRLNPSVQPGVQRVRLADYGVRLSHSVQYWWYVTLVIDPDNPSENLVTGGAIERIEPTEMLRAQLAQAGKADIPHIYAAAGLWYDALSALSDLLDTAPHDPLLRRQWASLLEQGDLPKIAQDNTRW